MRNRVKVLIFLGIFFCTGCGKVDINSVPTPPLSTVQPVSTLKKDTSTVTSPATSPLQTLTETAKTDLAQRLSIPVTKITFVEAKAVTWSDSSLGCPQEGFAYSQVLTPGYLIILEYANNQYEYHAGKGADVIYCPNPTPPVLDPPGNT